MSILYKLFKLIKNIFMNFTGLGVILDVRNIINRTLRS